MKFEWFLLIFLIFTVCGKKFETGANVGAKGQVEINTGAPDDEDYEPSAERVAAEDNDDDSDDKDINEDDDDEDDGSHGIMGRAVPQINAKCIDGAAPVLIEGVSSISGENGSKIVATKDGITSAVSFLSKDGTIILFDKATNPELKHTDADDVNLLLTENAALFTKENFYKLRVGDPAKMTYVFGGWNQVFLGCPQPVCMDGKFDAMMSNASNVVFAFRGKHFWRLAADGKGQGPTMANAMLIKSHFPTVDTYLTAACSDAFGNIYLLDIRFQVHAYMKNMDSLAETLLPGITQLVVIIPVWDYMKTKMFRRKPFYMKQLPNGYHSFAPTDWRQYYPLTAKSNKEMAIDAAFVTKSKYENGGHRFWAFNSDTYMAFDFFKVARYALREKTASTKVGKDELEAYCAKVDPTNTKKTDFYVGPEPVTKLNKQFPVDLESAFDTNDANVGFSKSWDFFSVPEKLFDAKSTGAFQATKLNPKGDIYTSLLNCENDKYSAFGGLQGFLKKYKDMLTPQVDKSGSGGKAPSLGVGTLPPTKAAPATFADKELGTMKAQHMAADEGGSSVAIIGLVACFVVLVIVLILVLVFLMKGKKRSKTSKSRGTRGSK